MRVDRVERLDAGQLSAVLALAAAAEAADHVPPLSEQALLVARDGSTTGSQHFLAYDGTHLAGYAHLEPDLAGGPSTAEAVVDPADRRQGVGTAVNRALEAAVEEADGGARAPAAERAAGQPGSLTPTPDAPTLQIWSHGHLDGARALAVRDGYVNVRELWSMHRSLRPDADPLPDVALPEGFRTRRFVVGQDEDPWLRVNALAFADHPEQGRITRHDLDLRVAEPWFDATGFILIEDMRGPTPVLAASHWTKVVPAAEPGASTTSGEVYVVGVDPAYQGLGLGRAVSVLGVAHLRERGLPRVMLYVDADNSAAVATYGQLGFTRFAVDVMYSRVVRPPVRR